MTCQRDLILQNRLHIQISVASAKSVLEAVLAGNVKELVLVNCCDTIRSVYDILEDSGKLDFLYMVDMLTL